MAPKKLPTQPPANVKKSVAKLPPPPRAVAKKTGPKKNQVRGAAPSKKRKENVSDKVERLKKSASAMAVALSSGVNYHAPGAAAQAAEAPPRSHKKAAPATAVKATPLMVYRFVTKKWGLEAHDDRNLLRACASIAQQICSLVRSCWRAARMLRCCKFIKCARAHYL